MEKMKFSRQVELWQNIMHPFRRFWISIATRFGIRKTGNNLKHVWSFIFIFFGYKVHIWF